MSPRWNVALIQNVFRNCNNNNITPTGSELFTLLSGRFAQISSQIVSIRVKKPRNTDFVSSRHIKREEASLPVDVRRSKTPN